MHDRLQHVGHAQASLCADGAARADASSPTACSIISLVRSMSALGRSILLMTGMISSPLLMAMYALASVCASTPCDASTTSSAPSHEASERETS